MAEIQHGHVTVVVPDDVDLPGKAGQMSPTEVQRLPKARKGVGLTCLMTAEALVRHGDRINVSGVDAETLQKAARGAEAYDAAITDLEAVLVRLKQANLIHEAEAHEALRRVLAAVRAQEKFDPRAADVVPELVAYFANSRG